MAYGEEYKAIVVGGGPAGLSAGIYGEADGTNLLIVESAGQLGGQAGQSSKIENLPGFPGGISGPDLIDNMVRQATDFGTEFEGPLLVDSLERTPEGLVVASDGWQKHGQAILVATGVQYRLLPIPNLLPYLGHGAQYGSPSMNTDYTDRKLFVVGGANSAGQAAMHLSTFEDSEVHLVVRGKSIDAGMSEYLADRVRRTPNIRIHTQTEVVRVDGNGDLGEVVLRGTDGEMTMPADNMFVLIGADPKTAWLPEGVERDKTGRILTGTDISDAGRKRFAELVGRQPFGHETSESGIFAAGDVRFGTFPRVANATGDAAGAISEINRYCALPLVERAPR